jgi:hypothetical protein
VDCCLAFLHMRCWVVFYVFYDYHGHVSLVSSSRLAYDLSVKRLSRTVLHFHFPKQGKGYTYQAYAYSEYSTPLSSISRKQPKPNSRGRVDQQIDNQAYPKTIPGAKWSFHHCIFQLQKPKSQTSTLKFFKQKSFQRQRSW